MVTLRSQRATGKSVPPETETETETPDLASLEFCKFMSYGISWEKLVLPDKFGSALMGRGRREVKLRVAAGGGERRAWGVEVVPDEYGDVYLAGGWREFARANGLDLGQLLFFRYDGAALLTVTVLEGRPYQHEEEEEDEEEEEEEEENGAEGNSSPPAPAPASAPAPAPTGSGSSGGGTAEEAGTDDPASSQFSVMLRTCHFGLKQKQYMHVPMWFQEAHGYTERSKVVLQIRGESWTVNLKHSKLSGQRIRTAFRYGWHQFCVDNDLGLDDTCFFRALPEPEGGSGRSGGDHVLRVEVRRTDGTIVQ